MTRQPRYLKSGGSRLLFFCEVVLIAASFYTAARIDLDFEPSLYFLYEGGLERTLFVAATILVAMYFHHLYADVRVRSRVLLLQQLCEVFGITLVSQSLVVYLKPDWILPRWLMIYGVLFSLVSIFTWRVVYSQFVLNIVRRTRIVFVGSNQTIRDIARDIANAPGWGYEVMGYVAGEPAVEDVAGKYLGTYTGLAKLARTMRPDRIVVGMDDPAPMSDLLQLHYEGLSIEEASRTYESLNQKLCMRDLDQNELIFSRELTPGTNRVSVQRVLDQCAGGILFIICLPFMIVTAAALLLTSREPLIVRRLHVGYNGKPFEMLRFRNPTRLTSLIRRLHLDALPELINVIRGEMALVGPRPESPEVAAERALSSDLYDYRLNVPPGMTGWAQINLTHEELESDPLNALEYDLYYIKHMSQALKTYILVTTLKNRIIWGG